MATNTWASFCTHASDAEFRTWGKKIHDELVLMAEITNTADTGQINWATVTRPGTSTNGGYQIYYLNDTMHATAPLYFRIDFGTHTVAARPRIQITVGTGTDGAGVITGTALAAAATASSTTAATSAVTNYTSYLCVDDGYILLVSWGGSTNAGLCASQGFIIARTCDVDNTAAPNAKGATVYTHSGVTNTSPMFTQNLRFVSPATVFAKASTVQPVYSNNVESTTLIGGNAEIYLAWHALPEMWPNRCFCGGLATEIGTVFTTTFAEALVGTTSCTFMFIFNQLGYCTTVGNAASTTYGGIVLWQ